MGQTYSGAAAILHDALKQPPRGGQPSADLLEILSAMARPDDLAELLLSLGKDDKVIDACAERSFRHPLGFSKLTLIDALPLFNLRVHVWWPGDEGGVDHVHNHRFSFVSGVVGGSYDMQLYEQDPAGFPVIEYRENVSPELGWRLDYVATTRIRPITTIRLQPGTSYKLPAETLHRVTVQQAVPCVTLFLQTTISRSTTQVFIKPGEPIPSQIAKQPYSGDDYRRQLESILALLRA
jgi:hypothetical protein